MRYNISILALRVIFTLQNMMTHTFRGCTYHTPCFIHYAFYQPILKNPSNKLSPLNLNFDSSKAQQSIYIASFWSAAGACISFLCFIKYNNLYFNKGLHPPHLLLHFYNVFYYIKVH